MKFHATDGEHRTERVYLGGPMRVVLRVLRFRSLCGRWMPDDERWAPVPTDVTCETCKRVLKAREAST